MTYRHVERMVCPILIHSHHFVSKTFKTWKFGWEMDTNSHKINNKILKAPAPPGPPETRFNPSQEVHALLHEKGSNVPPSVIEKLEFGSEYVFGQTWMNNLDSDLFEIVNAFQLRAQKNASPGKLGYKVHLLKGLLSFYRNLDTHKNDYPQLMAKYFESGSSRQETVFLYFDQKFPLFFMQIYVFAVNFLPYVASINQRLESHQKLAASYEASLPRFHNKLIEELPRKVVENVAQAGSGAKTPNESSSQKGKSDYQIDHDLLERHLTLTGKGSYFNTSLDANDFEVESTSDGQSSLLQRAKKLFLQKVPPIDQRLKVQYKFRWIRYYTLSYFQNKCFWILLNYQNYKMSMFALRRQSSSSLLEQVCIHNWLTHFHYYFAHQKNDQQTNEPMDQWTNRLTKQWTDRRTLL